MNGELVFYAAIAAVVTCFWALSRLVSRRRKRRKILESEKWMLSSIADAKDGDEEHVRAVKLLLYHFFEIQWQKHCEFDQASGLLNRIFWDCANDKLEMMTSAARLSWQVNHNPQPPAIVRSILGAAALAELNNRIFNEDPLVSRFATETKVRTLKLLDDFSPTLQVGMWRLRFPDSQSTHRLSPFVTD
jgi:hypothetical protein